jgi:integrase
LAQGKNELNEWKFISNLSGFCPTQFQTIVLRYKYASGKKTYGKRGFATKKEALQHEAEMKVKLQNPGFSPLDATQGKQTVKEYLEQWIEVHGKANLRPSTFDSYKGYIRNHIVPAIGHVQLRALSPAMIDDMLQKMSENGLAQSSVRYAQRILSVSLEAARKYRYIEHNPARDIITKFGKEGKTPRSIYHRANAVVYEQGNRDGMGNACCACQAIPSTL